MLASAPISAMAAAGINQQIQTVDAMNAYPRLPDQGVQATVILSAQLSLGQTSQPVNISLGGQTPPPDMGMLEEPALLPAPSGPSLPPVRWFEIQKAFGPVHFQKIGIRYAEQRLFILLDMSLTAGGLTIELTGLGLSSTLQHFDPEFTIEGIAVTFAEGPVSVSGGLEGTIHPVNLVGELVISAPELTIAALGAYAEVDHHPSFFLYAVLDYPIGGPAAFFVTGLALGFGFNRKLVLPSVAGVATFPFVEWAMGTGNAPGMDTGGNIGQQVDQVLETLSTQGVVAPSIGEDWLAVGVRFTSYELLNSFALATVIFGTEFELALLGLSRLSIPVAVKPPVAQAELAIKAAFVPKSGLLSISAQLTPNSYILSPSSHLTGGFVFYLWFSGPHAGEFVVTLGGYSPRFTPPEYYPQVPRLGLNWALPGGNLTIKGDLYFALTSSAVMAGGELSAVWHSGDLRAWFTVQADFLMVFKPFHYYISASISIGASFRINLLFTKVTETIHVGVSLQLWGPQFTGVARVDLSIISFTIHFGDSQQQTTTTISWREFVKQLLPGTSTAHIMALPAPEPAVSSMVQITVTRGLIKALSDQPDAINAVVNGETFEIVTLMPSFPQNVTCLATILPWPPTPNSHNRMGNRSCPTPISASCQRAPMPRTSSPPIA
ncbi:hypothetical protein C2W62_23235 [Candidatus Entotheonella serta]|nr:hypothetical protein C2W62_23235 [Candidatus Entotheonella serta]